MTSRRRDVLAVYRECVIREFICVTMRSLFSPNMCWRAGIEQAWASYATQPAQQEKSKVAYLHLRDLCLCNKNFLTIFKQNNSRCNC
jgi:hypothetical protein